jgi:EmrB/QacA subfamily drug resistance transporter
METNSRRNLLLVGLLLGMFFSALDQTIVGTAMPRIIGELGGLDILTWVSITYMLTSTTVVPIAGKLADIFGRRPLYVSGLFIFMLGSALCGTSQSMTQLILYRGLQGIGGGILMPMAMIIIGDIFPPGERGKWQGVMGAMFGLASVVGPTVGGWIVDHSTWRWVFYINMPVGILAAVTIYLGLHGEQIRKDKVAIDFAGAGTLIVGIVTLLLGLSLGGKEYPWGSWQIIGLLSTAFVFLLSFVFIEGRVKEPILSLDFFKNKVFMATSLVGFLMGLGMFGAIMFLPLYMQGVIGISATASGNTMIPMMFAMMTTSILGGQIINKVRFRTMLTAGMGAMAIAFYFLSTMSVNTTALVASSYIVILGFGMGLVMPTLTIALQNAFPPEQRGVVTSSSQFFRSIGGTLGMTLLGIVMNNRSITLLHERLLPVLQGIPDIQTGPLSSILSKAESDPQGLFNMLLSPAALQKIPAQLQQILLTPLKTSLADSLHLVFLVGMGVMILGVGASLLIGDAKIEGAGKKKQRITETADELS